MPTTTTTNTDDDVATDKKNDDRWIPSSFSSNKNNKIISAATSNSILTYHTAKWLILRGMGAMYAVAFWGAVRQNLGLLGQHGLVPAREYWQDLQHRYDTAWQGFHHHPSVFWWIPMTDATLQGLHQTGLVLSLIVSVLGVNSWVLQGVLWMLYFSVVTSAEGSAFYQYGWESQILETGFLTIFLCALPYWDGHSKCLRLCLVEQWRRPATHAPRLEQQQQQQQQQQRKEFPQQHSSPPQSSTTIPNEPQQKQQQQTANDENEELLQLAANPQAESQSSSPPQATTPIHLHRQPTPTTTPRQKVTFDNDGWYRVIEVLKLPVHDEATGDETDELREEEIVASLHKTMDDAQKDCDFRQQLANRNYQDRATGAISAKTPAFRVEAPTVSTTESPQ